MEGMGWLGWPFESCCSSGSGFSVAETSSTRLASLFVHCLLDFSSRGWSVFGMNARLDLLLRKRNWIVMVSSLELDAMDFRAVELGVATFWEARCVMVVKGWISRIEDPVWWMWK